MKHAIAEVFRRTANKTSVLVGSPWAFLLAFAVVLVWAFCGPVFGFSDTWQLVINTGTTIVTFLMVFLIQSTQNRDSRALHVKLDELILYTKGADNELVDIKDLSDEQLDQLEEEFHRLGRTLGRDEIMDTHSHRRVRKVSQRQLPAGSKPRRRPLTKVTHGNRKNGEK